MVQSTNGARITESERIAFEQVDNRVKFPTFLYNKGTNLGWSDMMERISWCEATFGQSEYFQKNWAANINEWDFENIVKIEFFDESLASLFVMRFPNDVRKRYQDDTWASIHEHYV